MLQGPKSGVEVGLATEKHLDLIIKPSSAVTCKGWENTYQEIPRQSLHLRVNPW